MKRAPELQKLSHDHHRGLVLARRLRQDLSKGGDSLAAMRSQVLAEYDAVLRKHFEVEERFLLPPLQRAGWTGLADRLLRDHDALRALVALGPGMQRDDLRAFAALLEAHIRFEERELFEEAQRALTSGERMALAEAIAQG